MDLTKFYGHTPGPWRCILNNPLAHGDVVTSEGDVVARIRGWGWLQKLPGGAAQQDANGRLIAAAPELLAEVRRLTAEAADLSRERDELAARLARPREGGEDADDSGKLPELPPMGHPLQKLGARLAELLDDDHWAECERLLLEGWARGHARLAGGIPVL